MIPRTRPDGTMVNCTGEPINHPPVSAPLTAAERSKALIADMHDAVAKVKAHDHGVTREDLFCLNLVAYMGERMGSVLEVLATAERERDAAQAHAAVLRGAAADALERCQAAIAVAQRLPDVDPREAATTARGVRDTLRQAVAPLTAALASTPEGARAYVEALEALDRATRADGGKINTAEAWDTLRAAQAAVDAARAGRGGGA